MQMLTGRTLGEKLKELRMQRAWSQEEASKALEMKQRNYSRYERDEIVIPNSKILQKVSQVYDIPLDVLLGSNSFSHIPPKIINFIQCKDSVPFLVDAYKKYQEYLEAKDN